MAVEIGTASNFADLQTRLIAFLTTNPTLVAAGQAWSVLATEAVAGGTARLLRGPGTAGADEILVSVTPVTDPGNDIYNLGIIGYPSYNPSQPLSAQVGQSNAKYIHLLNASMPYWFIANGRRFIVIVRVSTVYQCAYAGFILPYHLPTTWAYPLFVGGCSAVQSWRFSQANAAGHSAFFNPGAYVSNPSEVQMSAAVRLPDGQWAGFANKASNGADGGQAANNIAQWSLWMSMPSLRRSIDNKHVPIPAELALSEPYGASLGALEGVFYVPGFQAVSEDTFVAEGKTYIIIQNVYRTANHEYAAFALE